MRAFIALDEAKIQMRLQPVKSMRLVYILFVLSGASGLRLSVSSHNALKVISPSNDDYVAEEGESIYIECVSENHFSRNSSLMWNINTKVQYIHHLCIMFSLRSETKRIKCQLIDLCHGTSLLLSNNDILMF